MPGQHIPFLKAISPGGICDRSLEGICVSETKMELVQNFNMVPLKTERETSLPIGTKHFWQQKNKKKNVAVKKTKQPTNSPPKKGTK